MIWKKKCTRGFLYIMPELTLAHPGFKWMCRAPEKTASCPSLVSADTSEMDCRPQPQVAGIMNLTVLLTHSPSPFTPGCLNPLFLSLSTHPYPIPFIPNHSQFSICTTTSHFKQKLRVLVYTMPRCPLENGGPLDKQVS